MTHPILVTGARAGLAAWAASSMLRVVSRLVRPEFLVVIEIVAAKA